MSTRDDRPAEAKPVNPDCAGGKHQACAGDAWDDVRDQRTTCTCPCHQPVPTRPAA